MKYSFIIPVYNRPDEVDELLESLCAQHINDFEVIVVEDGSAVPCADVVARYKSRLDVRYFFQKNAGPGRARNFGAEQSRGEFLIILDSDCVLPPGYLDAVEAELHAQPADAFGGPDKAHADFTPVQKAINYSMTSFFTTGGIRGGKKKMDKFYPRSFNMGVRRSVYLALNGFSQMRFGEDIDFSIRIFQAGYACRLFPEAWVWHKRRVDMKKFFKQVHNFGIARINLYKKYPTSLKLVHLLPAVFTCGVVLLLLFILIGSLGRMWIFQMEHNYMYAPDWPQILPYKPYFTIMLWCGLSPLLLFSLLICVDATLRNRSAHIGVLSIGAAFTQLLGYGSGFWRAWWRRCVLGKDEFSAYTHTFYK